MKTITTAKGESILVDDDDYDFLMKFKWRVHEYKSGTPYAETGHKTVKMHRLIMGVTDENIWVDHKDGNGLNNQKSNLRIASKSQNAMNKKANGEVPYKGVIIQRQKQKYFHKKLENGELQIHLIK